MNIKTIGIWGIEGAIRGMRNPMNSHDRSDSFIVPFESNLSLGNNDLYLMKRLIKGGPEHAKFTRFIHVQADWTFPRYFWSEADTYKFVEKNSESTMHTLLRGEEDFSLDQFEYDDEDLDEMVAIVKKLNVIKKQYRKEDSEPKKNALLTRAKKLLPEGFLQTRTIDTNYQELWNMYRQRVVVPHRLKTEWIYTFGKWCEELPYFKELFLE